MEFDSGDHRAAGEEWGQGVEEFGAAVERADAGGGEHFVPGECGEIDTECGEVYWHVGYGLAGVQDGEGTDFLGECDEARHIRNGAGDIGDVGESEDAGFLGDEFGCGFVVDLSVVGGGDVFEGCAGALGEDLPGYEVGVVFDFSGENFVAGFQGKTLGFFAAESLGCVAY